AADLDVETRFLAYLAHGALPERFPEIHRAAGHSPFVVILAPKQQDSAIPVEQSDRGGRLDGIGLRCFWIVEVVATCQFSPPQSDRSTTPQRRRLLRQESCRSLAEL